MMAAKEGRVLRTKKPTSMKIKATIIKAQLKLAEEILNITFRIRIVILGKTRKKTMRKKKRMMRTITMSKRKKTKTKMMMTTNTKRMK